MISIEVELSSALLALADGFPEQTTMKQNTYRSRHARSSRRTKSSAGGRASRPTRSRPLCYEPLEDRRMLSLGDIHVDFQFLDAASNPITGPIRPGDHFFLEAYVQDGTTGTARPQGVLKAYWDVIYDPSLATAVDGSIAHDPNYNLAASGTIDNPGGRLDEIGGSWTNADNPALWPSPPGDPYRLFTVEFVAQLAGTLTFNNEQATGYGHVFVLFPGVNPEDSVPFADVVFGNEQSRSVVINSLPTVSDFTKPVTVGDTLVFSPDDFIDHFVDPDAHVPDTLQSIKITDLPDHGTLKLGDNIVSVDDEIAVGDLGNLRYVSNPGYTGSDPFAWKGSDGKEYSEGAATVTIQNNAAATLTIQDVSMLEGDDGTSMMTFTVTLSGTVPGGFTVDYQTADGTATVADGDYIAASGPLPFAGTEGETHSFTVTIIGDTKVEADETFTVSLSNVQPANPGVDPDDIVISGSPATGTILNDDQATLTITDVSAPEGDAGTSVMTFTVTLSAAVQGGLTVDYHTADGTATVADGDYIPASDRLPFAGKKGESQTFPVTIIGDYRREDDETFRVALSNVVPGDPGVDPNDIVISGSPATGTILNDDVAGVWVDPIDVFMVIGGDPGEYELVLLSEPSADVTIACAPEDPSYATLNPTIVTFTPDNWDVPQTVTITLPLDNPDLPAAFLIHHTVSSADADYEGMDIDPVAVYVAQVVIVETEGSTDVTEGGQTDTFHVGLLLKPLFDVMVTVHFGSQLNVDPVELRFTVADWDHIKEVTVAAVDDDVVEGPHTAQITFTAASEDFLYDNIPISPITVRITDNDTAVVSVVKVEDGSEAGPTLGRFKVQQTKASSVDTVISYTVSGTAAAGSDYTALSRTVTIPAGALEALMDVPVLDDQTVESAETVIVTLTGISAGNPGVTLDPVEGHRTATVEIADNDTAMVSVAKVKDGAEAGPSYGRFKVVQTKPSSRSTVVSYTVSGTATAGSDYAPLSGTVTIRAGQTEAFIAVGVLDDQLIEGWETVVVTLTGITAGDSGVSLDPDAADRTASVAIRDDDTATVSIVKEQDGAEAGPSNGRFKVVQTKPSVRSTVVSYTASGTATAGSDYTALSGRVRIPAGATQATIDVRVLADNIAEDAETVTLTLTAITSGNAGVTLDPNAGGRTATLSIADNDAAGFIITPTSGLATTELGGTATFAVVLKSQPTADVTINLYSSDTTEGTVSPSSLTFSPSNWSVPQTVTVTGVDDADVDDDVSYTIVTSAASSADPKYNGLNPDDVSVTNQDNEAASGRIIGWVVFDTNHDGAFDPAIDVGLKGVTVRLTGTDNRGAAVQLEKRTDENGRFAFEGLRGGTYTITEVQPIGFVDGKDWKTDRATGVIGDDQFSNITLQPAQQLSGYYFGERDYAPEHLYKRLLLPTVKPGTPQWRAAIDYWMATWNA